MEQGVKGQAAEKVICIRHGRHLHSHAEESHGRTWWPVGQIQLRDRFGKVLEVLL